MKISIEESTYMNLDKIKIGRFLSRKKLWDVPLRKWNAGDLHHFAEAILEATEVTDGTEPPYIDSNGDLIIPYRSPLKYRYWMGGQSLLDTLIELGASEEVARKYLHAKGMELFKERNNHG